MSGGEKTIEQRSELPSWATPNAIGMLERAGEFVRQPYKSRVAGFNADQDLAMGQIRSAANSQFNQGYSQDVGNTLRGYAAGNSLDITKAPGFDNALQRVQQAYTTGVAPQTAAAFYNGGAGPAGSDSAYQETMGYNNRAYADSLQKLIGDQYNTQQGFQMQAASALPQYLQSQAILPNMLSQIGQQQQQLSQAQLQDAYDYPREQLDFFGNQFTRAIGGQGNTYSPNPARGSQLAGALGGGLAGAGIGSMIPALAGTGWGIPLAAGIGALGGGLL